MTDKQLDAPSSRAEHRAAHLLVALPLPGKIQVLKISLQFNPVSQKVQSILASDTILNSQNCSFLSVLSSQCSHSSSLVTKYVAHFTIIVSHGELLESLVTVDSLMNESQSVN